jgi:hypothetical protein
MNKTFAAFAAVATIAGSLVATPVSAQRGVAPGVAAPGRYYEPVPYWARRGPYDDFWQLRMGDTAFLGWQSLAGPPGKSLRLIRDGDIERHIALGAVCPFGNNIRRWNRRFL